MTSTGQPQNDSEFDSRWRPAKFTPVTRGGNSAEAPRQRRSSLPTLERPAQKEGSLTRSFVLLAISLVLALAAAVSDAYLHRGIETSAEPPYVQQVSGKSLATNLDLRAFPPSQIEAIAATMRANGFRYVRHPVFWSDIEPAAGEYNWETYDAIFTSFNDAGIDIVATISGTPIWARDEGGAESVDAPPADPDVYAEFVRLVVQRYVQYLRYFQIGDLPNDPSRWGGNVATPEEYLAVLIPSFNAVRTASPDASVILAEFSPSAVSGSVGDDTRFLRGVYDAGGAPYFDVVAARIDGGGTSPHDRRVRMDAASFSRAVLFREVVHDAGDDTKPVWLTHYGWDSNGPVDRATQADYLVAGIERAREEWPWSGLMFQWGLQPDTLPESEIGFALLNSDGTATESFVAVASLADTGVAESAPTGFVPTDAEPMTYRGTWSDQHLMGQVFQTTSETNASVTIRFEGTGLTGFLRRGPDSGLIRATLNGSPLPGWPAEDGSAVIDLRYFRAEDVAVTLASELDDGSHEVVLSLDSEGSMTLGGAVVSRDPPLRWPVVVALISSLALAIYAIRKIMLAIGRSSGIIRSRSLIDDSPSLPSLPDWRPSMKT